MKRVIPFLFSFLVLLPQVVAAEETQPNIVLVFMDNFGWGEIWTGLPRGIDIKFSSAETATTA